ncbi:MAG TPA: flavodoxin-dependent (E)-4-hydroxy-3-methylbut-2-enyl-diphosphate synthase, partial [Firmicutes bacterium]|nr:flavodoxin-dependent (E)-4-hydroxy-3-methylbut-2-enyl-diphosphate synthase [Bacillota bacterium]
MNRRKSWEVKVGNLTIGGGAPVIIQSMTNTVTSQVDTTLAQIEKLSRAGCELVRVAVPDEPAVQALPELMLKSPVPLVADIHFDSRLALQALDRGVPKVRINPGNIGGRDKFREVVRRALSKGAVLRLGVNAGSLDRPVLAKYGEATPRALVESALNYLQLTEEEGFKEVVVSLKASDVLTTIEAYRAIAPQIPYPLHIGVTEAGPAETGL